MLIWILFALLTAAATIAVLAPMMRARAAATVDAEADVAVYRDQIAEIDRDLERGVLAPAEATAARTEIARRLIRADEAVKAGRAAQGPRGLRRAAAVLTLVFVPASTVALYLAVGSPDLPDQPVAARECGPDAGVDALVVCVERHLARNPDDAEGWKVVAPIYLRLGRAEDAADAYGRVMALTGETPALLTEYAGALMMAGGGIVSRPAMTALEKAMAGDPDNMKARFIYAEGRMMEGRPQDALAVYDDILARSAADAPWIGAVTQARAIAAAAVGGGAPATGERAPGPATSAAPGPSADDVAAALAMPEDERRAMVEGMVAQLAGRLDADGADLEGWLRLIRAYDVLGESAKRDEALGKARAAFAGDSAALARIDAAASGG